MPRLEAPELAAANTTNTLAAQRRRAIWALYRYAGVRLAELAWSTEIALPRLEAGGARAVDALCLRQGAQGTGHSAAGAVRDGIARLPTSTRPAGPSRRRTRRCL
ncbi:hypothetical protein ACTMU2_36175 (plasmid) [Cupriavidus basilensis]